MAAGRGLRMMPLTQSMPKPMIDVNGATMIAGAIRQLKEQVGQIAITVGYRAPELAKHCLEEGVSTIFNTNERGNAWWVFNTLMRHLDEPVLVLTCDNIVRLDLHFILDSYHRLGAPACMVVPVRPVAGIEGDYIFSENYYVKTLSRKQQADSYCSGIQVLNPRQVNLLTGKKEDFADLWDSLIGVRQLRHSAIYPGDWYAIDTVQQLNTYVGSEKIQ